MLVRFESVFDYLLIYEDMASCILHETWHHVYYMRLIRFTKKVKRTISGS